MSRYSELVARRVDPARGEAADLEVAILDCQRILRYRCGVCPELGRCVLHRKLLRQLDYDAGFRERVTMVQRTAQFNVDGQRCTATLVRLAPRDGGASYRVTRGAGEVRMVTVPAEEASAEASLVAYLTGQIRLGGPGVSLLTEG